jgi:hypothetical protein
VIVGDLTSHAGPEPERENKILSVRDAV